MHEDEAQEGLFDRFEVLGSLGRGGMGSVSLAYDRRLRARVALKSVGSVTGAALLRFKREFRAVKGLRHPNLVSLDELFEQDGQWYLSMEYVEGVSFLDYVRPHGLDIGEDGDSLADSRTGAQIFDATATSEGMPTVDSELDLSLGEVSGPFQTGGNGAPRFDEGRLRHCFLQLLEAVYVLHEDGRAHRDLKPSNVLVTPEGRVVVLDFGLISETDRGLEQSTGAFGTPAYMAPEQARGRGTSTAVDLYAMGVMLYEALGGCWPVFGSIMTLLRGKQDPIERRPSTMTEQELPEDLEDLCMELLALDPDLRPSCAELFPRVGAEVPRPRKREQSLSMDMVHLARRAAPTSARPICLGRDAELELLDELLAETRAKRARHVLITGDSGIGKTTLIREALAHFAETLPHPPWILYGRCFEHEQVRYKAFDSLVDRLSSELPKRMPTAELRRILPPDAYLLPRAFPVLQRVAAFSELGLGPPSDGDPESLQRRMIVAFRVLITRLAARFCLVLVVEDLQWTDAASWSLLEELVGATRAPPCALITTARSELIEGRAPSLFADAFLRSEGLVHIKLGPLSRACVAQLTALHHGQARETRRGHASFPQLVERLTTTTGGHPLYLDLLLRRAAPGASEDAMPSLAQCLRGEAAELSANQRSVLELIALSERPMDPASLSTITGLEGEEIRACLERLRAAQWIRSGSGTAAGHVSVYHSQVREAVITWTAPERQRELHLGIAGLLAARSDAPERVVEHLLAGGAREQAIAAAAEAASAAMEAMAYEQAADLYSLALERPPTDPERARALCIERAQAFARGGRRVEAARAYLEVAEQTEASTLQLELRAKATLYLLGGGDFEQADPLLRALLRELGVAFPRSAALTMAALVRDTLALRVRSRRVQVDADAQLGPEQRLRLELCQAGHWVYAVYDLLRTGYFSTTFARLALRTREASSVARGLSHVAGFVAFMGDAARASSMFAEADALLAELDDPLGHGTVAIHRALASVYGEHDCAAHMDTCKIALARLRAAGEATRGDDLGVVVRGAATLLGHMLLAQALERAGELTELELLWRELSTDTKKFDRDGAPSSWVALSAPFTTMLLSRGRIELALEATQRGVARLEPDVFLVPHFVSLISRCRCAIHRGEAQLAVEELEQHRSAINRSFTTRAPDLRADIAATEACARLAWRLDVGERRDNERELQRALDLLTNFPAPYHRGRGQALRAAYLAQRGRRDEAHALLGQAIETFTSCNCAVLAAAAKLLLPRLRDDEDARALRSEGLRYLFEQGVVDPEHFADLSFPGCTAAT